MELGHLSEKQTIKVEDFPERQVLRIEGIEYSYDMLKAFGEGGLAVGSVFKIVERKDGIIELKILEWNG